MYDHWYNPPSGAGFEADVALMIFNPFEAVLSAFDGATADLMAEEHDWEGLEPRFRDPAETVVELGDSLENSYWIQVCNEYAANPTEHRQVRWVRPDPGQVSHTVFRALSSAA